MYAKYIGGDQPLIRTLGYVKGAPLERCIWLKLLPASENVSALQVFIWDLVIRIKRLGYETCFS